LQFAERVNARAPAQQPNFVEFGFRLLPGEEEYTIELAATPSPADVEETWRGAQQSLRAKYKNRTRWRKTLNGATTAYNRAQSMPEKNKVQRAAKQAAITRASRSIKQAEAKLAQLAIDIPADENNVRIREAEWNAILAKLEPVRNCMVSGELWRRIGDVRIPVLRMVPVELSAAPEEDPNVPPARQLR
jgi:hypothetical protein